jgi:CheY-like chemotaxis protein
VQEVVALMQPQAQAQGLRIEVTVRPGSVVRGDRLRVKQVLLNLCANAVKYTRPGGWVRLGCEPAAEGRLRITVEDNGQGISSAGQARLFEPFTRLAEHAAVEGTDIGLSISKRLVELMDGRIGVSSTPGEGSRFWIELPGDRFAAPPPPEQLVPESNGGDALAPATVLYVEDNPDNLSLVMRIIERHPGVRLVTATSAAQGYEMALAHRPDLLLVDLHLGDRDGYSLLWRLRSHPELRGVPAVAVTANAMPMEVARATEAGFAAFFTKPIDVGRFDTLLRSMLGRA